MFQFRIGSIPVSVSGSFFLIIAILGFDRIGEPATLASWVGMAFVAIIVHELGHAAAFAAFGLRSSISLHGMGGLTRPEAGPALTPGRSFLVSVAGPAVGFVVGGVLLALGYLAPDSLWESQPLLETVWQDGVFVNLGWSVFNMLPIQPMDGGHALHSVLSMVVPGIADVGAVVVSLLFLVGLGLLGLFAGDLWILLLCGLFFMNNVQMLQGSRVRKQAQEALAEAQPKWEAGDAAGAWDAMKGVPPGVFDPAVFEEIADRLTLQGDHRRAAAVWAYRHQGTGDPVDAYEAARAHGRSGQVVEAVSWLDRAVDAGFADADAAAEDEDLAALRQLDDWPAMLQRMRNLAAAGGRV